MTEKITIDDLYSDTGSFDEEAVLKILKGKVIFTREHEIQFTTDPSKLKARDAVLLYALAKKILKANQKIDDEIITRAEIVAKTRVNDNTIGVTLMRLGPNKGKQILMPSGSGYEMPTFKVAEALKLLTKKEE